MSARVANNTDGTPPEGRDDRITHLRGRRRYKIYAGRKVATKVATTVSTT